MAMAAAGASTFTGTVDVGTAPGGMVEITAQSTDGQTVSTADSFAWGLVAPTNDGVVDSRDGWVDLSVLAGSTTTTAAALIYSGYAPAILGDAGFRHVVLLRDAGAR